MKTERQYNIDFLRILACFAVVLLHFSVQNWTVSPTQSFDWKVFNLYRVLVAFPVPVFFMISGKLFLSKDSVSLKKLYFKNIGMLVILYFLWSFLYAVDLIGVTALFTNFDPKYFFTVFCGSKYHLWYLTELAGLYMLVPIFIAAKNYKNGKILEYICIASFVFGTLIYSIKLFPIPANVTTLLSKYNFTIGTYSGYFILGYLLDKYKQKFAKFKSGLLIAVFLLLCLVSAVLTYFFSLKDGKPTALFYSNCFITTYFEAAIIFLLFMRIKSPKMSAKTSGFVLGVSKYTRFVYLLHPFFLERFDEWFSLNTLSFNTVLSVPAISILTFIVCIVIAFVIDKIPIAKKILL